MNLRFLSLFVCVLIVACTPSNKTNQVYVKNMEELEKAIAVVKAGDHLVLANGTWTDAQINFYGHGTSENPIRLSAETAGKVFLEGQSYLHLGGEHLIVEGLFFRNGYSPKNGVIRFQIGKDSTAFHSRVSQTVVGGFTQPNRWDNDRWVELYGQHNQFDHNYLAGKSNDGATMMVYHKGNQHTNSYHIIENNHFGPRPRKGGPRAETLRLGGSETSMTPGKVMVKNNFFDRCNGEVEIISDKTNYNSFLNNIFYKCEGSLVMRHSDYTTVNGNLFIGDDDSDFYGGIRVINTGHWITNNYFYKIKGEEFRSPLAVMNGIPKSSLNRYKQVTDAVVAYNTWVDCRSPFQIGVGQNIASSGVLPKSEIRSAPPIRTILANNIIYNTKADVQALVNHDDISGIQFEHNIISNNGDTTDQYKVFEHKPIKMKQLNPWLYFPLTEGNSFLDDVYEGFDFKRISRDLFGQVRTENNRVGAMVSNNALENYAIDTASYGPSWFDAEGEKIIPTTHQLGPQGGALEKVLAKVVSGDIIELSEGVYRLSTSWVVDKAITLKAAENSKVVIAYDGAPNTPAFQMHPHGRLQLSGIKLQGSENHLAFAPLEKNMSAAYKLFIDNSSIENFGHLLLATKGSFADSIQINNSHFKNAKNGFVLAADQKGDYNAEMFSIANSTFEDIDQNVVHFYRGGYDESTIGGYLTLVNNTFERSGKKEKSQILIKTRGIINVLLDGNTFKNNPVKRVAVLWGAKNNHHKNNLVFQSGEIEVQEQQALEILY